mgnify:CR=1 FL=1
MGRLGDGYDYENECKQGGVSVGIVLVSDDSSEAQVQEDDSPSGQCNDIVELTAEVKCIQRSEAMHNRSVQVVLGNPLFSPNREPVIAVSKVVVDLIAMLEFKNVQ